MAKLSPQNDVATIRRERVAALRARGLTLREIQAALADPRNGAFYMVNPSTGAPYDLATISRDMSAVRAASKKAAGKAVDDHRARQFAELQEIKRAAWAAKDSKAALAALGLEMKLLGTAQETITLNINIELINRVIVAADKAGLKASDLFENLIQELNAAAALQHSAAGDQSD